MHFKSVRQIFLPDEGCLMVKADFSQMESRIGNMYCGTERMIALANSKPWEFDAHTDNAAAIFGEQILDLPKAEFTGFRYLGKKVVHAAWRKMGGNRMSESVSKDTDGDIFMHPAKCSRLIRTFLSKNPEIEGIYFPWVEDQVYRHGLLYNSFGRRYDVRNMRIDDDLLRGCYSYFMQSDGAGLTNNQLLKPGDRYMMANYGKPLNMQIHDEVVASLPPEGIYDYCVFLKEVGEQPKEIPLNSGTYLSVALEFKISDTLYGGIEFNQLPERVEFEKQLEDYFGGKLCGLA